jgi:regulatory protein
MNDVEQEKKAKNDALKYLSYRSRTEVEIIKHLSKKHSVEVINKALVFLKNEKLVDDQKFAEEWTRSRVEYKPRSTALIKKELIDNGIEYSIADEVVKDLDELGNAYRVGKKALPRSSFKNYAEFYVRIKGHLQRRGFNYGVISQTIQKLWSDRAE